MSSLYNRSPTTTQRAATTWISWDAGESSSVLARQGRDHSPEKPVRREVTAQAQTPCQDDTASETSGGASDLMSKSSLTSAEFWGMDSSSPSAGRFVWALESRITSHRRGVTPAVRRLHHRENAPRPAQALALARVLGAGQEEAQARPVQTLALAAAVGEPEHEGMDMPEELRQLQGTWMDEKDPVVCYQVTGWWCQRFENRLRFGGAPRPQHDEEQTEGVPGGKEAAFLLCVDSDTGRIVRGEKTDVMVQEASEDRVVWRARPGKHKVKRTRAGRKVFTWVRPTPPGLA
mmetsp:Transcript_61715/g.165277  ORF Transcript_61715/g.165277 Transcript_61715/m.165277 type:complete len:290 (-) Transcript_61715:56-925(-)